MAWYLIKQRDNLTFNDQVNIVNQGKQSKPGENFHESYLIACSEQASCDTCCIIVTIKKGYQHAYSHCVF
jgi:hypothetical protein